MNEINKQFLMTYVDINRDGEIIFKSTLNLNIFRNVISKNQALRIIYDVLHEIKSRGITDIFDVNMRLVPEYIEKYKQGRRSYLTYDDYINEVNILIGYIKNLTNSRKIDINVLELNNSFIKLNDFSSQKQENISIKNKQRKNTKNKKISSNYNNETVNDLKNNKNKFKKDSNKNFNNFSSNSNSGTIFTKLKNDELNIKRSSNEIPNVHTESKFYDNDDLFDFLDTTPKLNSKKVKKYLKKFNKEELCEILDYNPKSCFESEKSLRNEIIQLMRENFFNDYNIESLSLNEFKRLFKKHNNENITKNEIQTLISDFNNKTLDEMYDEKDKYYNLYGILSKSNRHNKEMNYFIEYYDLINDNSFMNLFDYFKENPKLIHDFNSILNDYSYIIHPEKIIDEFNEINDFVSFISNYPMFIKNKIFKEIGGLNEVYSAFMDMKEYNGYLNTSNDNIIKIHNEKVLDFKFAEINVKSDKIKNINDNYFEENNTKVSESFNDMPDLNQIFDYSIFDNENEFKLIFNLTIDNINKIISNINIQSSEFLESNLNNINKSSLISDLESYISNIQFKFSTKSFNDEEINNIILKIKSDIAVNNIYGDIKSIVSFYLDNYKSLKNKYFSFIYVEEYIKSKYFKKFLEIHSPDNIHLDFIIEKIKKDIIDEKIVMEDIQSKIKIYIEQFNQKTEQNKELEYYKQNKELLMEENNLTSNELNDIFNKIQILVDNNYGSMKSIKFYLDKEIKNQISINQSKSRKILSSFLINDLKDIFEKTEDECEYLLNYVEKLIFDNKVRSEKINLKYLFILSEELDYCD